MDNAVVRARREALVREHMAAETELDFDRVMATFSHPRYELIGTGTVFDGEVTCGAISCCRAPPSPTSRTN